jgi:hypothetical protein
MNTCPERNPVMKNTHPRRVAIRTALTTLVVVGLLAAATANSQANSQVNSPRENEHGQVLRFGVQFSPNTVIDVPPLQATPGDYKPGDYTVFGDELTDQAGRHAGTEAGTGTITRVDETGAQIFYSMAIQLDRGQITASGIGSPDPNKFLAVTGGTGSFTGASGSLRVVENGDAGNTGSLEITLH